MILGNEIFDMAFKNKNSIVLSIRGVYHYYNVDNVEAVLDKYSYPTKYGRKLKIDLLNFLKGYEVDKDHWDRY